MSRLAAAAARAGPLRLGAANGPGPGILAYIIESISVTRSPTLSHCQARAGAESDSETRRPGATNGLGSYSKMLPMTRDPGGPITEILKCTPEILKCISNIG